MKKYLSKLTLSVAAIFSFFKKKPNVAILREVETIDRTESYVPYTVVQESRMPSHGTVRDITMALDNESVELYGRSPYTR